MTTAFYNFYYLVIKNTIERNIKLNHLNYKTRYLDLSQYFNTAMTETSTI